jgi:hypothetical protein
LGLSSSYCWKRRPDTLLENGVERLTADATAITAEILHCVLPELQDGLTLVGPKGCRTGMLLTERACDDHVTLHINLGHYTAGVHLPTLRS